MRTNVRAAVPADAVALLELWTALDHESSFMLLEPGERKTDPDPIREQLSAQADGGSPSYTLVAADGPAIVGYVRVSVSTLARARRTGYVVMGVRASRTGEGVGKALLLAAIATARERELRRLELTVMAHNRVALNLYLSCGFVVEGLRRAALSVAGNEVDEYYMGLLLGT